MKRLFLRRATVLTAVCGALFTLALGGCEKNRGRDIILYDPNEEAEEQTLLTFFGFKADAINLTAIESALQSFMAEKGNLVITYEGVKGAAYYDILALRSGTGHLDDVFMVDHDRITQLSREGKLADLSDVPGLDNFTAQARGQFTNADGTVYFLPTCISTYNLYINYDLLEAHHQDIPTNWVEFQQVCDYFVSQGIVPIIANNYASLSSLITSRGLYDVYQRPDADEIVRALNQDADALVDVLMPGVEQVADMIGRGWFDPAEALATAQTSDDLALFAQGNRPFMISGGWASVRVEAMDPGFSYGVYPYPILEDGSVLSIQVDTCISVSADSETLEEAKEFVAYLIQPDVMWTYCDSQASYTPLREEKRIPSEKTLVPSTEYLNNGRSVIRSDYRLTLPLNAALLDCANTLLEGGTVPEAEAALREALEDTD